MPFYNYVQAGEAHEQDSQFEPDSRSIEIEWAALNAVTNPDLVRNQDHLVASHLIGAINLGSQLPWDKSLLVLICELQLMLVLQLQANSEDVEALCSVLPMLAYGNTGLQPWQYLTASRCMHFIQLTQLAVQHLLVEAHALYVKLVRTKPCFTTWLPYSSIAITKSAAMCIKRE